MANIFDNVKVYDPSWKVADTLHFTKESIDCIKSAQVQVSKFGMSVCFMMKAGGMCFIPLDDEETEFSEGEFLDLNEWEVKVLVKEGRQPIKRMSKRKERY